MDKIFINGKEFPSGDLPKSYGKEPKRNPDTFNIKYLASKRIAFTKEGYEKLKEFYNNFEKYKGFAQNVLTEEEYDVWLYQNQYIKDNFFDDNPPKMLIVDDVVDDKGKKLKISKKDMKSYQKLLKMRLRENE